MEKVSTKNDEVKKLASWISEEVRAMLERLKQDNEKAERVSHVEAPKQRATHV